METTNASGPAAGAANAVADSGSGRGGSRRGGRPGRGGPRGGRRGGRGGSSAGKAPEEGRNQTAAVQKRPGDGPKAAAAEGDQASKVAAGETNGDGEEGHVDGKDCFICASPIIYSSIAPCKHVTCHICSLRMRALYKNKKCPHCRTPSDYVIFTEDGSKEYTDFDGIEFVCEDPALGIKFETQKIYEDVRLLLQYNCPDMKCDVACLSWADLQRHVSSAHQRVLCNLCVEHKHCFAHEHQLFTTKELRKHERFGDDRPGAIDQSGFKGHPECGFCRIRFYTGDELYTHCREKHERCFLCDRNNPGKDELFANYNALEQHFRTAHFMCQDPKCIEERFVVFGSEIDLKAHQVEKHPDGLSKSALKDIRRIDMTNFDPGPSRHDRGRRGRGRGGRGGSDSLAGDREPPAAEVNLPLRRDEIAFQRAMAVQSAAGSRTFGGQLTQEPTPPPRPTPAPVSVVVRTTNSQAPPPIARETDFPTLGAAVRAPAGPPPGPTSVPPAAKPRPLTDEEIKARHQAVVDRATNFAKGDKRKIDTFRTLVSQYKSHTVTAAELVDKCFHLFGVKAADLGTLMRELSELYEEESKKAALLKAWNSWKAQNEKFPPISSASSSLAPASTSRVLRVKSSTAPSRGPWDVESTLSTSKKNPAISASNSSTNLAAGRSSASSSYTNLASRAGPSSASNSYTNLAARAGPSRPGPASTPVSSSDFPSLPPKKPFPNGFGPVEKKNRGPVVVNAWTASKEDAGESSGHNDDGDVGSSKKKGKGKGKQTLFHFG